MITMDICGGGGPNLTEATATAGQIASGYVAYGNNGVKITGTQNSEIVLSTNISIVNQSSVSLSCIYMSGSNIGGKAAFLGLSSASIGTGESGTLGNTLCTTESSSSAGSPILSDGYVIITNRSGTSSIAFSSSKTNFTDVTANFFPASIYPGILVALLTVDAATAGSVITVVDG